MKRLGSFICFLIATPSLFAQTTPQDFGLPELHAIKTVTPSPPYSCRSPDQFKRGYESTALFLSRHSKQLNRPDLLFNGACKAENYFQSGTDIFSLIADHRTATITPAVGETFPSSAGFVLRPEEGEILVRGPERTENIKLSPRNGALGFGLVTTRMVGSKQGISIHRHLDEQEAFFVHRGRGLFILGDQRIEVREGDIVFIPQGVWHGFENAEGETLLLWVDSPPVYLGLHRIIMQFDRLKLPQPAPETQGFILQQFGYESAPKSKPELNKP